MAAGGVAFVGSTGEDYAVPFLNAVVLDTDDPAEIGIALDFLRSHPDVAARLRSDGQETARSFSWENVIVDTLLGKLEYVAQRQLVNPPSMAAARPLRGPRPARPSRPLAPAAQQPGHRRGPPAGAAERKRPRRSPWPMAGHVPTRLSVKPQTTRDSTE